MTFPVKPIYLLADSQLLFWQLPTGEPFLARIRMQIEKSHPKAAYVGASNGDLPEFYELFRGAMQTIDVEDCRMIPTEPSEEDLEFFDEADIVLLAGGDVRRGWRAFKKNGLKQKIVERYYGGTVLIGISAGAIQLGLYGFHENEETGKLKIFETMKLVPALIDAHQEPEWARLERCVFKAGEETQGLGIPTGGGAVLHQDLTIEPIRRSLTELRHGEEGLQQSLIFPPGGRDDDEEGSDEEFGEGDIGAGDVDENGVEISSTN